jgi:hypothetical protein
MCFKRWVLIYQNIVSLFVMLTQFSVIPAFSAACWPHFAASPDNRLNHHPFKTASARRVPPDPSLFLFCNRHHKK